MNTEQRIDNIENKVDNIIVENTKAFNKLSDTMDAVCEAMKTLGQQVIENQKLTTDLAIKVEHIEQKLS